MISNQQVATRQATKQELTCLEAIKFLLRNQKVMYGQCAYYNNEIIKKHLAPLFLVTPGENATNLIQQFFGTERESSACPYSLTKKNSHFHPASPPNTTTINVTAGSRESVAST